MGGLLQMKSAPQLESEKRDKDLALDAQREQAFKPKIIDNLAAHVHKCWSIAKSHRSTHSDRLTDCLRRRKGQYSDEKMKKIKEQGGADIYMNITGTKINAAKSWLSDLYAGSNGRPFDVEPTPVPELPPEIQQAMISTAIQAAMQTGLPPENVEALLEKHEQRIKDEIMQEAEQRMERMGDQIEDILAEGNYRREFEAFLDDLCTYPVAILKGPIYKRERSVKWVQGQDGSYLPKITDNISRKFRRVSPFDFYPSPSMTRIGDNWHIEHRRFTATDLESMRGVKGYNDAGIILALNQYRNGGLREWAFDTSERETLEGRNYALAGGAYELIDGLELTGFIQGKMLIDWGIEYEIPDPFKEYPVSVIVIGNYTIKAKINPDPTGNPGYYAANFRSVPNSFYGEALSELISDIQDAANATARALINNMAIGAQPQVGIDVSRVPEGEVVTSIRPGKVWRYKSNNGQSSPGVTFFSPEIKSQELLNVYERFERYADEKSGIPAYAYGSDSAAGAGKTASGLSMLMNASSKTIKQIVRDIDIGVIEPLVSNLYQSLMLDPDVPNDCKGDAKVRARGSDALMHKEATAMRQLEFMSMTNNPVDMQIIGIDGRRELLETAAKNSEFPVGRIVPTEDEMKMRMANAQPNAEQANTASAADTQG
tara:strand:+ start:700 stop:2670 length:1971 start_codon:yes stop_codon:yes gene_type:complete